MPKWVSEFVSEAMFYKMFLYQNQGRNRKKYHKKQNNKIAILICYDKS